LNRIAVWWRNRHRLGDGVVVPIALIECMICRTEEQDMNIVFCANCDEHELRPMCRQCVGVMVNVCPVCRRPDQPFILNVGVAQRIARHQDGNVGDEGNGGVPEPENPMFVAPPGVRHAWVDEDEESTWNINNAAGRNVQASLERFRIVTHEQEGCFEFWSCQNPDYIEDGEQLDIRQHMYLRVQPQMVWLPISLPNEMALAWISNRTIDDNQQHAVVSAITESRLRDVNLPSSVIMDCKLYIPNISNFMVRDIERLVTTTTTYAHTHRWRHAMMARTLYLYYFLVCIGSSLMIYYGEDISYELISAFAPAWVKRNVVAYIAHLLVNPVLIETAKRTIIVFDGSSVIFKIGQNRWINFWWAVASTRMMNVNYLVSLLVFCFQLFMGTMRLPFGLALHLIMVLALSDIWHDSLTGHSL
jgi:hypothetical protein